MPGPGHYCIAAADGVVNGPTAPAWTIAARAHDATAAAAVAKSAWPGPATYDVTRGGPQGPAYSMQGKAKTTDGGECCRCIMALLTVCKTAVEALEGREVHSSLDIMHMTGLKSSKADPVLLGLHCWCDVTYIVLSIAAKLIGQAACNSGVLGSPAHTGQGGCTPGPVDYSPDPNILLPSVPCFTIAGRGQADSSSAAACATSWSWSW